MCHGCYAEEKNGSAASELRCRCAWLHHGRVLAPTEYKVVARLIASESGLPSDRHPDRTKRAGVLEAVKVWPGKVGVCRKIGATANLDSSCARWLCNTAGRGEETGFQVEQRNRSRKQARKKVAALKPLDNKDPIQGNRGRWDAVVPRVLWGFACGRRGA